MGKSSQQLPQGRDVRKIRQWLNDVQRRMGQVEAKLKKRQGNGQKKSPSTGWPPKPPPTQLTVAASDSSSGDKDVADYVCDGTEDDAEIKSAFGKIADGGVIRLFDGTYYIRNMINFVLMPDSVQRKSWTLSGTSQSGTVMTHESGYSPSALFYLVWGVGSSLEPWDSPYRIGFSQLTLDGKSTVSNGVYAYDNQEGTALTLCHLNRVSAQNMTAEGIQWEGASGFVALTQCSFDNNGGHGILCERTVMHVNRCSAADNGGRGWQLTRSGGIFTNTSANNNADTGFYDFQGVLTDISGSGNGGFGLRGGGHATGTITGKYEDTGGTMHTYDIADVVNGLITNIY